MNGKVKDFMKTDLPSVGLGTTLEKVRDIMARENVDFVLVKEAGDVIGVITLNDVLAYMVKGRGADELKADSFMTSCNLGGVNPCLQVFENSPVDDVCAIMGSTGVNHLLVFGEGGKLIGVITARDIMTCGVV